MVIFIKIKAFNLQIVLECSFDDLQRIYKKQKLLIIKSSISEAEQLALGAEFELVEHSVAG